MNLLSIGNNKKLSKKVAVFNLPQGKTCPGATEMCKIICYAKKAERKPNCKRFRERNYRSSKRPTFVKRILKEIDEWGGNLFRIHESGDMYSNAYLNKWIRIAEQRPKVKFLVYTKVFNLDFSKKPDNMVIYYSLDETTKHGPPKGSDRLSLIIDHKYEMPEGWHFCGPVGHGHYHYCGDSCHVCWKASMDVAWLKH